jgi:D-alanyl-D-alanine carboxypeptidase
MAYTTLSFGEPRPVPLCTQLDVPHLEAHAAYAFDIRTGKSLIEVNPDASLPLASITKLMTAYVAHETLGDEIQNKIDAMLISSSNELATELKTRSDAAQPEPLFIDRMNTTAQRFGFTTLTFMNETGLDISSTTAGAYGSARDVARFAAMLGSGAPELVERSVRADFNNVQNTSLLAASLPGARVSKTGFTDLAGGNLVILYEPVPGRPVSLAVLGSTREGRETDMRALINVLDPYMRRAILCNE